MRKSLLVLLGAFVLCGAVLVGCRQEPETPEKPTLESITLSTGEQYVYYCFKSIRGAELWLYDTYGIKYESKYEVANTLLDKNVKDFMIQKGYNVTATEIGGIFIINVKRDGVYYNCELY